MAIHVASPLLAAALALGSGAAAGAGEARVSLDARDAPVVEIVRVLAEAGGFQVVFDPGVDCRLTLKLKKPAGARCSTRRSPRAGSASRRRGTSCTWRPSRAA